jgi:hypothetical protein
VSTHPTHFQELFTMKTIFKRTQTNLLIASMAAGLGVHLSSQAQTTDAGTLVITGQITASTCTLNVTDVGTTSTTGAPSTKNLALGNLTPTAAGATGAAGSLLTTSNKAVTVFSLSNAGNTGPCTTLGTGGAWDLALMVSSAQVSTIGSTGFLKNGLTANATDAVVQMFGGVAANPAAASAATASTALNLRGDAGYTGNFATGAASIANFTAQAGSSIVVGAQWARATANAAPSSGSFSQSIPLAVVYK